MAQRVMRQSKRILITGGAGFIGSHLAAELRNAGHEVRVFDNYSIQVHGESPARPEVLPSTVEVIRGDIRNQLQLDRAISGVDVIFHFAASVGVGQSMYEVRSYVDNNVLGTANLLQLLIESHKKRKIEKLIVASSMSLYGEGLYEARSGERIGDARRDLDRLREHDWETRAIDGDPLVPIPTPENKQPDLASVYALSKYDQERLCLIVGGAYQIPTTAMRFFNVYGRGQALSNPYTGVMAIFASRLLNNQAPRIFEDGNQRRDFVHVSDVARACRLAMEAPDANGRVFNIGSGENFTIREIAEKIAKVLEKNEIKPEITQTYRVGDIRHCFADISLAKEVLGYQPLISLETGLKDLAQWLRGKNAMDRTEQAAHELAARGLAV